YTPTRSALRLPTPLIFSLFPYTTLFRSETSCQRSFNAVIVTNRNKIVYFSNKFDGGSTANVFISHRRSDTNEAERLAQEIRRAGDRKSTRLNSSHLGSSYAVFCLKKKTT